MSRHRLPPLAVLAAVAATAVPATAADARARCHLAGRDLAPGRAVTIVRRDYEGGERLVGCVRPHGRPRVLIDAQDMGLGEGTARLVDLQGTWALVSESAANQYGYGSSLHVVDVAGRRRYDLFAQGAAHGQAPPSPQLRAYAINARGWAAAIHDHLEADRDPGGHPAVAARRVVLHDPWGRVRQLALTFSPDEIDPGSLVLDLRTVLWTQGGAVHYRRF